MEQVCAQEAVRRELEARGEALDERRHEEQHVLDGRKPEGGGDHIDHGINRLVELRPREHGELDRGVLQVLLDEPDAEEEDRRQGEHPRGDGMEQSGEDRRPAEEGELDGHGPEGREDAGDEDEEQKVLRLRVAVLA